MTELEARAKALEQLAADHRGYAMNWPGRLVAVTWQPTGAAIRFAIMEPVEPSFTVRALGDNWLPLQTAGWKVMLAPRRVSWRWSNPWAAYGYQDADLFVYSLTDTEHDAFLAFVDSREAQP